jgi:DNA-binding transcriptional LysR family regulator
MSTLKTLVSLVVAGKGVTVLYESSTSNAQAGIVYRDLRNESGPTSIGYAAIWNPQNDNPALRRFLSILRERYGRRALSSELAGCG